MEAPPLPGVALPSTTGSDAWGQLYLRAAKIPMLWPKRSWTRSCVFVLETPTRTPYISSQTVTHSGRGNDTLAYTTWDWFTDTLDGGVGRSGLGNGHTSNSQPIHVHPGLNLITFHGLLHVEAFDGASVDFGGSSTLFLELPDGVTFEGSDAGDDLFA